MDEVRLPDWWCYPRQCERGHPWGPGRVLVRWRRCWCVGLELGDGHIVVECVVEGCRSAWLSPPHRPESGEDPQTLFCLSGGYSASRIRLGVGISLDEVYAKHSVLALLSTRVDKPSRGLLCRDDYLLVEKGA